MKFALTGVEVSSAEKSSLFILGKSVLKNFTQEKLYIQIAQWRDIIISLQHDTSLYFGALQTQAASF